VRQMMQRFEVRHGLGSRGVSYSVLVTTASNCNTCKCNSCLVQLYMSLYCHFKMLQWFFCAVFEGENLKAFDQFLYTTAFRTISCMSWQFNVPLN